MAGGESNRFARLRSAAGRGGGDRRRGGVEFVQWNVHCISQDSRVPLGFWWFSRKKDPWKKWKWKLPLELRLEETGIWMGLELILGKMVLQPRNNLIGHFGRSFQDPGLGVRVRPR